MKRKSLLFLLLMALLAPWAVAQQALPYSYGFEDNDLSVDGWELVGSTSTSTGIISDAAYNGSSYGFRFNYSEHGAFLMSPLLTGTDSGVALSFYYKEYSSSYGDEQFYVGYTTDETNSDPTTFTYGSIVTASTSWQLYETTLPAGVKRVAIQYVYNDAFYLYLDDFTFEAPASCVKPSGLAATLTPGNGTVATLNWTAGGTETAWVLEYGTASDFTGATSVNVSGTPTKALTGLVAETTYYARVKANCGGGDQSDWCNDVCIFTPSNALTFTVNDGTVTNNYVPYYSYYHDSQQRSEFIIPASSLEDIAWGTITSMKFYPNYSFTTTASIQVYLMEVSEETFSDVTFYTEDGATIVYTGTLGISPAGMTITCGEGYQYMGGNLLVGFYQATPGDGYSSSLCPFYGVTAEGASIEFYGTYATSQRNFLPKITFGYIPGEVPTCLKPTGVTVSEVTAHSAVLSWTSEATAWQIQVNEETPVNVTANPYTLTGLEPETDYAVKVRANCGSDGYSDWTTAVSFTTEPACLAPTDMVISDITAYSANIAWTSENTNFELRYSPDVRPITTFDDSQMHGWTNIDADGDGYEWVLGSECGGVYLVETGSLAGSGHNGSADLVSSGSYSNMSGVGALTPDNYLVSPQITLGGSISFWACAQDGTYAAEHFGVAVSTTGNTDPADFTTIQEWDMTAKSAPMLRSSNAPRGGNRDQGNWYQYTVDLSAYSGQGYVAIRHFDCTDMFILNVDDINIEQPGFEMPWVNVSNPTNPQALTNLDPETTYLVQVRANCGSDGYSEWLEGSFTTLPSCMVPTGLVVSNIDKRSADIAWVSNGDEEAWQICVNGDEDNLIYVTENPYTLTDLEPDQTQYIVKVRAYCDETLQSAWSTPVTFYTLIACPAPTNLTVTDITGFDAIVSWVSDGDIELEYAVNPWMQYDNGVYATSMGAGGTLYWGIMLPAESLTAGEPLTKVALHTSYAGETTLNVYLGGDQPTGTPAATQTFTMLGDGDFMEIVLDTPVDIDGTENLWITFYNVGVTYPADGCEGPTDPNGRWVSLDGEDWADIAGYGFDYTWMIRAAFGDASLEWVTVDNATSPQAITDLEPETNYFVRVKHICGGIDGESDWTTTVFTTDEACPAPNALVATPYANSAVLSWEGTSDSYTVSYRTPAVMGGIDEQFAATSIPTGWSTSNTLLTDDVLNGTTTINSSTGGWAFGSANGVFNTHARVNIYGTTCKYWLITPAISVPADATFSFDLALTAYTGTSVPAPSTTGTDDRFVVLISTDEMATWTILRQWDNNDGSVYVYNDIANTATGENVSFDFSDYARQTVYIAFYGESTTSNADNNLHIDNVYVTVDELIPAGEWETVTVEEATATITGLEPETTYEWKVEGDCGEYGMSEESAIASFTTTDDLCPLPTDLDATNITATTADLTWTGSPDVESFVVRYRASEHIVGGISEEFSTSIPTGWETKLGLLSSVMSGDLELSDGSQWVFGSNNGVFDNHARINIYGTQRYGWLISSAVELTSDAIFTFDLALTAYSGTGAASGTCDDDRFVVLVTTDEELEDWTILREWNNSDSEDVYNEIPTAGTNVSIDLSAYAGQSVRIAFYGESTVTNNGDNNLHIDNVVIGDPVTIPATEWEEVRASSNSLTLEDLTPETPYEAQVQNDCDSENWSAVVTFTTTEEEIGEEGEIEYTLPSGWSWISSNIEYGTDAKAFFENAIAEDVNSAMLKAQGGFDTYDGENWTGNFPDQMMNEQMYMISADEDVSFVYEGNAINPAEHPITLNIGWTWIGNMLDNAEGTSVEDALAGMEPNPGDLIKGQGGFSIYGNNGWVGQLTTMYPGQGFIYNNSGTEALTLIYPSNAKSAAPRVEVEKHWTNDVHRFATNLSMMATIDASVFAVSEYYEIGAFVNGECRGSARLQKVDGNYVAFLTVSGNDGDQVNFMLFDVMGNEVKGTAEEGIVYVSDDIIGSVNNPMMLHFNNTGVNELDGMVSMFPNPTKDNVKIFGNGIQMVKVYNTLGQMVYSEECGNATEVELNLSAFSAGVYTVSVLTNGQVTNKAVVKE